MFTNVLLLHDGQVYTQTDTQTDRYLPMTRPISLLVEMGQCWRVKANSHSVSQPNKRAFN